MANKMQVTTCKEVEQFFELYEDDTHHTPQLPAGDEMLDV